MTKTCRLHKNKAAIDDREPPDGSHGSQRLCIEDRPGPPVEQICNPASSGHTQRDAIVSPVSSPADEQSEPVVAQLGRIVGSSLSTPSLDYVPAWAASLSCAARRCVRGWRRSYPGVVLDVLLELGDELGGEGTPRLADGVQDVARGHLLLAALE